MRRAGVSHAMGPVAVPAPRAPGPSIAPLPTPPIPPVSASREDMDLDMGGELAPLGEAETVYSNARHFIYCS